MGTDNSEDILSQFAQVAEKHFAKLEREAARALIFGAFDFLPWELQEGYWHVVELYRQGKRSEASQAWEEWMEEARELGVI